MVTLIILISIFFIVTKLLSKCLLSVIIMVELDPYKERWYITSLVCVLKGVLRLNVLHSKFRSEKMHGHNCSLIPSFQPV